MCRTAGWPARGPVIWTSCALALAGASARPPTTASARKASRQRRSRTLSRFLRISRSLLISARQPVLEVEGQEDRQADVGRDVVDERRARLHPGRGIAAVLAEGDLEVLELL